MMKCRHKIFVLFDFYLQVDRGAGTSVDALVIFDIKDGKKQHVSQHSFTIGLLFMGRLEYTEFKLELDKKKNLFVVTVF